jgi:putative hydrolase of the HAD superfamily
MMTGGQRWTIGFDADDTLWQNEGYFQDTQTLAERLLAPHADIATLHDRLMAVERRNLPLYGFGVKGFILSLIETALDVTDGRVPQDIIAQIIAAGRAMLDHPVDLIPGAQAAVEQAARFGTLVLITKGDLGHQERKIAASGLAPLFAGVAVVSDKTPATYARIFAAHPARAQMMIGNSLKSDVIPALQAGAWGVHVPQPVTWAYEIANPPADHPRFRALPDLSHLPGLLSELDKVLP